MDAPARIRVIDLFSGVGGFSLGAIRAGCELAAAIDLDRHAISAHERNFPSAKHARRRIQYLRAEDLSNLAQQGSTRLDGLIGGPPCQGFSTMGRMRRNDARNKLFYHFFRLVSETNPLFFLAENVPGILNEEYGVLREEAIRLVQEKYHLLHPMQISAADLGASTSRSRVFFFGWAKDSGVSFTSEDFKIHKPAESPSVRTAFAGLPFRIDPRWREERHSWQQIQSTTSPFLDTLNRRVDGIGDHAALKRFAEQHEVSGFLATRHTRAVASRFSRVKPGETDAISRFPRLDWDGLCPTLRAGTGSDRGSHQAPRPIHPSQNRVITTREAARLQGFPDWFQFDPTKWHSFRQIGNSVSPLVAEAILSIIARRFGK